MGLRSRQGHSPLPITELWGAKLSETLYNDTQSNGISRWNSCKAEFRPKKSHCINKWRGNRLLVAVRTWNIGEVWMMHLQVKQQIRGRKYNSQNGTWYPYYCKYLQDDRRTLLPCPLTLLKYWFQSLLCSADKSPEWLTNGLMNNWSGITHVSYSHGAKVEVDANHTLPKILLTNLVFTFSSKILICTLNPLWYWHFILFC